MKYKSLKDLFYLEGFSSCLLISTCILSIYEIVRIRIAENDWYASPYFLLPPAALGAYVAFKSMRIQVLATIEIEEKARERRERASKAAVSIATSKLMRLSENTIRWHFIAGVGLDPWEEYEAELVVLNDCIKNVDETSGNRLLGIVRTYQVLHARMRSANGEERDRAIGLAVKHGYYEHWSSAVNWAVFRARLEQVLVYVRSDDQPICSTPVNQRVESQFFDFVNFWDDYPQLREIIDIRSGQDFFEKY